MTWTLTTHNGNHSTAIAATASSTSSRCSSGTGTYQAVVENSITNETIENSVDQPTASIYPNPSKGLVTINIKNGTLSSTNVQIIDAFGRVVPATGKKFSDQSIQIDLAVVRSGVYFIRILVDNEYKIFRVVKM
jgi:S-adenosylmethionine synthetase